MRGSVSYCNDPGFHFNIRAATYISSVTLIRPHRMFQLRNLEQSLDVFRHL
ncbi:hypothetical protein SAMN05216315_1345 [Nitrosospira sp. Nsp18]|nr:hypothetical protein SAMN05216315_1345 [Nitrosospira sp. Nsp18]